MQSVWTINTVTMRMHVKNTCTSHGNHEEVFSIDAEDVAQLKKILAGIRVRNTLTSWVNDIIDWFTRDDEEDGDEPDTATAHHNSTVPPENFETKIPVQHCQ